MENITNTPSKSYLQYGVLYALAMILSFVVVYTLNIDLVENPWIGTLSSVFSYLFFPILFIYLGVSIYKKSNLGFLSFGEALKVGVTIAFIGGLLFAVFNVIFNLIFPEFLGEILNQTRQIMLKQNPNLTSEQVEMGIAMAKKFSSPWFSFPVTLLMFSFIGLIYSLIIGAIVKKDKPQFS
jgi:hypothetical protein